jgi:hypothetical protein
MSSISTVRSTAPAPQLPHRIDRLLLGSGIAAAALYIALDIVAGRRYPEYSFRDQAISELSATGAPTAMLWSIVAPVFGLLLVAVGAGVWRRGSARPLRIAGALMLTLAAMGPLWALFPMHQRGTELGVQDTGHLVLGAISVVLIVSFMISGGVALRGWFRATSITLAVIVLAAFMGTFVFPARVAANEPTPYMGVIERIAIYGYLAWIAVFAVVLLRLPERLDVTSRASGA